MFTDVDFVKNLVVFLSDLKSLSTTISIALKNRLVVAWNILAISYLFHNVSIPLVCWILEKLNRDYTKPRIKLC